MSRPVPVGQEAVLLALAAVRFRAAAPVAVLTVVGAVVVGSIVNGAPGAWGAGLGGTIAALSSLASWQVMRWCAALEPKVVMAASLGTFLVKMALLLPVLVLLGQVPGVDRMALALGMLAVFILVSTVETWAGSRLRTHIIEPLTS